MPMNALVRTAVTQESLKALMMGTLAFAEVVKSGSTIYTATTRRARVGSSWALLSDDVEVLRLACGAGEGKRRL
jgi:hypothetical protein